MVTGMASATVTLRGMSARASSGARPIALAANAVTYIPNVVVATRQPNISGE